MNKRKRLIWVLVGTPCLLGAGALLLAYLFFGLPNDLGLTHSDLHMGGKPDLDALRTKTASVADAFLTQHRAALEQVCGGPYTSGMDSTLSSKMRSLGYRSSFYYYCWDIYLPYSLRTTSGSAVTVVVQLSDAIQGHGHDPAQFRVLRAMVIDDKGKVTKQFEG